MFPKSSLPFAPVSGFVAFDGGGAMPPTIEQPAAERAPVVHEPVAEPDSAAREASAAALLLARESSAAVVADSAPGLRQTVGWQSAQGLRARRVEAVLLVAIVGYFVLTTLGGLHLF